MPGARKIWPRVAIGSRGFQYTFVDALKFKLTIAFEGTNYAGWQAQTTGVGVQQRVEEALQRLFPSVGRIHGSSRTDAGVHALGMVAHVEIPAREFRMPPGKLALALNAHLPEDIRVTAARRCRADFHARFDAAGKEYRYFVWNHPVMNPLWRRQAWQAPRQLDLKEMRSAARFFLGTHDFKSFAAGRNYEPASTIRTVDRCEVKRSGALISFVIQGDGFLYKMCRGIVGTLVQVGEGKISAGDIGGILASKDRRVAGMTAPARGLVLWRVFYHAGEKRRKPKAGHEHRSG